MPIDYKKELEAAAKTMILVHDPDLLLKMIVRSIVNKVKVSHASVLLYRKDDSGYVLSVSRGELKEKLPIGMARLDRENPLVVFFQKHNDLRFFNERALVYQELRKLLAKKSLDLSAKDLISHVLYQLDIFDSVVCVPSYFRDQLLGFLLLGKKNNGMPFCREELDFFIALASNVSMAIRNAQLFRELEGELDKKHQLFIRTTIAFAAAIEAKDNYTHGHTSRVTNFSLEIARKLSERREIKTDARFLEHLHIASLLHDIGKIGISESILNKADPLSAEEMARIREHPLIGVAILKPINELKDSLDGIKYHHERYDGLGYPEGLSGEQIPMMASIISVADSFDAMTTDRPYRPGLFKGHAVAEIKRLSGRQFNPSVAGAFVELCEEGAI